MFKKIMGLVLSLSLICTGMMGSVSFGAGLDERKTGELSSDALSLAQILTITDIMRQFGVSENWMDEQLSKGFTLFQIYKALLGGKTNYEATVSQYAEARHVEQVPELNQALSRTYKQMGQNNNSGSIQTTTASDYDQSAIEHLLLRDESSLYAVGYGEDSIAAATGDIMLRITDLTLPGALPFSLTRIYDSSRASEDIGVSLENGVYVNRISIRKEEQDSDLGRGWRWALPFIESKDGAQILDLPGIGRYKLTQDLKLQGYPWNDLLLTKDSSKAVGGMTSEIKLSVLNGNQYYFGVSGNLLLVTDNYGNKVEFYYSVQDKGTALSRILNNDGKELAFAYTNDRLTVTQTGTNRKVDYIKSENNGQTVLSEVKDGLGRGTKYFYSYLESRYNFLASLKDQGEMQPIKRSALLMRVIYPSSGMTEFDYIPEQKEIGEYATDVVFKAKARKNVYSTPQGDVLLHPADFSYSGEDLNTYGQAAAWTTTIKEADATNTFKLRKAFRTSSQPDIHYLDEQRSEDIAASTTFKRELVYDNTTGWNVPIRVTENYLQGGSESQPLTATYRYNDQGLILSENWSTGQETVYEYTTSTSPYFWSWPIQVQTKISEGQKRIVRYEYNDQGSLSQFTVRENSTSGKLLAQNDWEYDTYGNPIASKIKDDKRTNIARYFYESPHGKHLKTKQSMVIHSVDGTSAESQQKFSYSPAGELLTVEDEAGATTTFTYDALGRMIQTLYSDQTKTTMEYDDIQNTATTTGPEGIKALEKYDPLGLLIKEIVDDAIFQYTYDEAGNLKQKIDAENNITKFNYDGFGRLTKTLYADGSQDDTGYDMVNRTITYTDPAGVKQRTKLDSLGNPLTVEEWRNGTFTALKQATYDLEGNVVSVTDGNTQQTFYQHDALGRMVAVTDPEQRITKYKYSLAGDLIKVEYPDNTYVEKEYNEAGNLIRQINEERLVKTYYYDSRGNLTKALDHANQFTEYQYNNDNLLTGILAPGVQVSYKYDSIGHRTGMTDSTGNTTYTYDPADGSLKSILYPDGTKINYSYNKQLRTGYTLTDVSGKATGAQYAMDEMNQVSALDVLHKPADKGKMTRTAAPTTLSSVDRITFDYKANGLLERGASANGLSTTYSYEGYDLTGMMVTQGSTLRSNKTENKADSTDSSRATTGENALTATEATYGFSQLSAATGYTFTYQYDSNKNIITRTQNGASESFIYDPLNRIQQEESGLGSIKKYSYDDRGNVMNVEGRKLRGLTSADFKFDSLNRLIQIKTEDGRIVNYSYNGDGLLYERTEETTRTRYYYDEQAKLIAEADVSTRTPSMTYAYIYDLSGLLWSRVDQATGEVQYYQLNGHGDVVGLTDSQGNQLNTYTYDIWGNPETEKETVPNIFRYSGEYWDNTTDLQYLRARWYDPNAGRFIAKDTYEGELTNPLSLNLYTYVSNNPLRYVDPSGHYTMPMYPTPALTCAVDIDNCKTNIDAQVKGTKKALDIVYLDDAKTLMSDDASSLEKGIVIVEYIPVIKMYKAVKKTKKAIDSSKDIIKYVKKIDCNCFVAGTKITTDEGEKNIEDIEVGDKVLAKDENNPNGELAYKEVTALYRNQRDDIIKLHVGERIIETTDNHPFWVEGKGWVFADELQVGDKLEKADGSNLTIDKVEFVKLDEPVTVYNFTVADFHTYYVTDIGIWVHNTKCYNDYNKIVKADSGAIKHTLTELTDWMTDQGMKKVKNNKRATWVDGNGNYWQWDSKRGTLERWDKKQRNHLGEYDPVTGEKINDGIPSRRFDE
ncbi:tRNA3(Ser)-specific nuclease WapA precursor [compost metagenome]